MCKGAGSLGRGTCGSLRSQRSWPQELVIFISEFRREDLQYLARLMREGKMTPVIDRRYSLEEVPAAIACLEEGHARAKVVINVLQ